MALRHWYLLGLVVTATACVDFNDDRARCIASGRCAAEGDGGTDAGSVDGGATDAGAPDAGTADAGGTDAGDADAGFTDGGDTDAGLTDAGDTDGGVSDAGPDAGSVDAGGTDGGLPPTGQACSPTGWCWEAPFPVGVDYTALWAVSQDEAWAAGTNTITHYAHGAFEVFSLPATATSRLPVFGCIGPSQSGQRGPMMAATDDGSFVVLDDAGVLRMNVTSSPPYWTWTCATDPSGTLTLGGTTYDPSSGGGPATATWDSQAAYFPSSLLEPRQSSQFGLTAMTFTDAGTLWALSYDGTVYRRTGSGITVSQGVLFPASSNAGAWASALGNVWWAHGANATTRGVDCWSDAGTSTSFPFDEAGYAVTGRGSDVWVSTGTNASPSAGHTRRCSDLTPATVCVDEAVPTSAVMTVFSQGQGSLWSAGLGGELRRRLDGGTWESVTHGGQPQINDVWFDPDGQGFAVGDQGLVLNRPADGGVWQRLDSGTTESLTSVLRTADDRLWFMGSVLLRQSNGAVSPWQMFSPTNMQVTPSAALGYQFSSVRRSGAEAWGVGDHQLVVHYDGSAWRQLASPGAAGANFSEVWPSDAGRLWVAGGYAGSWLYAVNADGGWVDATPPDAGGLNGVWGASAEEVFVTCDNHGVQHRLADAGWESLPFSDYGTEAIVGRGNSELWVSSGATVFHGRATAGVWTWASIPLRIASDTGNGSAFYVKRLVISGDRLWALTDDGAMLSRPLDAADP
jgi:hypothetical protein